MEVWERVWMNDLEEKILLFLFLLLLFCFRLWLRLRLRLFCEWITWSTHSLEGQIRFGRKQKEQRLEVEDWDW